MESEAEPLQHHEDCGGPPLGGLRSQGCEEKGGFPIVMGRKPIKFAMAQPIETPGVMLGHSGSRGQRSRCCGGS